MSLKKTITVQILLILAVIGSFDLFHHVIPRIKMQQEGMQKPIAAVEIQKKTAEPEKSDIRTGEKENEGRIPLSIPLSKWKSRTAEPFSEITEVTENSYKSRNISIKIEKEEKSPEFPRMTYYVADIYLKDTGSFQTAFPEKGTYAMAESIAAETILAINGDCMAALQQGLVIRNGMIYQDLPGQSDYCVLYRDGSMETFGPTEFSTEEILAREPIHVWQFGPALLEKDGQPRTSFNISSSLLDVHPRTALGYYEPGHYCFVVVDGRQRGYSDGASMEELAALMSSLGCTSAFNLDGGASSVMIFNGKTVNRPSASRELNDMLAIREVTK